MGLGAKIRDFRSIIGLTQAQLADCVGVNRTTIINWEKGVTHPNAGELQKLAKCLNKDLTLFQHEAKKEDDRTIDHPLVKRYEILVDSLNKHIERLERENEALRNKG